MERMPKPKNLHGNIIYHSDYCYLHPFHRNGEEIPNPIQKMVINGEVVCPRCETEKLNHNLESEMQQHYEQIQQETTYNILHRKSIIDDKTLLLARFDNYLTKDHEETQNKNTVLEALGRYQKGETFNLALQGLPGVGKSHLAYSLLYELNKMRTYSCLFITIDSMMRKIRESFHDKESEWTEEYFIRLLTNVIFLCLDDLGAEVGAIDTGKAASDFVLRVLNAVATGRQDKSTILTTNLSGKSLYTVYDKKLVSRLFNNSKIITFKETKDKRNKLPF